MLLLTFRFPQSSQMFTAIVSYSYPRINGKICFTIADRALIIN
jgi:hypothetical protein